MKPTITRVIADIGENEVDVDKLHNALISELSAEKYLALFRKMHETIYGYPIYAAWNGGCGCTPIEEKQE